MNITDLMIKYLKLGRKKTKTLDDIRIMQNIKYYIIYR